jgi:hypothetical protein
MDSQTHNQSVVVIWTAMCILKYHKKILPLLVPRLLASIWFALLFQPVLRMLLAIALMVLSNGFSHKALLVSDAVMSLCRPSRIICSKTHTGPPPQKGTISLATKCRICALCQDMTLLRLRFGCRSFQWDLIRDLRLIMYPETRMQTVLTRLVYLLVNALCVCK